LEACTLRVETRQLSNRAYIVTPEGRLDVCTTVRLEQALSRLIELQASYVIVDLRETHLVDSAPLGLIVLVQRQLSRRGGRLLLTSAGQRALELLDATGLKSVLLSERWPPSSIAGEAARARFGGSTVPAWHGRN
jgi:anti-anti-sigma factor